MSGTRPVLVDDRSLEARILQVIALKAQGLKYKQIGEKLGISESRVGQIVWEANKKGLIDYANPHEYFENRLTPKIVQNIEHWLDQKDKKMTIEAAKGAGIFKAHQALKVEGQAPQNVIALKIEMPPLEPGQQAPPVVGMVVGKPRRVLEGQIVGDQEDGSGSAGAVSGSGEGLGTEEPVGASSRPTMALPKPKSLP